MRNTVFAETPDPLGENAPDEFYCPISQDIMHNPVIAPEGQSFELSMIIAAIARAGRNPLTRNPLKITDLTPNHAFKKAIEAYCEEKGIVLPPISMPEKWPSRIVAYSLFLLSTLLHLLSLGTMVIGLIRIIADWDPAAKLNFDYDNKVNVVKMGFYLLVISWCCDKQALWIAKPIKNISTKTFLFGYNPNRYNAVFATSDDFDKQVPDSFFRCPLSQAIMRHPVVAPNGKSYERAMITGAMARAELTGRNPLTNKPLKAADLIPNRALKALIATYCTEKEIALSPVPMLEVIMPIAKKIDAIKTAPGIDNAAIKELRVSLIKAIVIAAAWWMLNKENQRIAHSASSGVLYQSTLACYLLLIGAMIIFLVRIALSCNQIYRLRQARPQPAPLPRERLADEQAPILMP